MKQTILQKHSMWPFWLAASSVTGMLTYMLFTGAWGIKQSILLSSITGMIFIGFLLLSLKDRTRTLYIISGNLIAARNGAIKSELNLNQIRVVYICVKHGFGRQDVRHLEFITYDGNEIKLSSDFFPQVIEFAKAQISYSAPDILWYNRSITPLGIKNERA